MDLNFIEKVGDYTILRTSEIIVYNNSTIRLELIEGGVASPILFRFIGEEETKPVIRQNVMDGALVFDFVNTDKAPGIFGIFEPTEIAVSDYEKTTIYLSCVLVSLKMDKGCKLFKYSILSKPNNGCIEI